MTTSKEISLAYLPEAIRAQSEKIGLDIGPRAAEEARQLVEFEPFLDYLPEEDRQTVLFTALYMICKYAEAQVPNRDTGDPASSHPLAAAKILAEYHLPATALQKALLHDYPEECAEGKIEVEKIMQEIADLFGQDISNGIRWISIVKEERKAATTEAQDEVLRQNLFETLEEDPEAMLARFAERLHNLRTIYARPEASARKTARETLEIYVPLAQALGMYDFANEMAIISIGVLFPEVMKIIDTLLPAYSPNNHQQVASQLSSLMPPLVDDVGRILRVSPPSYEKLWQYLAEEEFLTEGRPPEFVDPAILLNLPFRVYVRVTSVEDRINVLNRLLSHPDFHNRYAVSGTSWSQVLDKLRSPQPLDITFYNKIGKGRRIAPFTVIFLTAHDWKKEVASIFDLHQIDEVDEGVELAALEKVELVKARITETREEAPAGVQLSRLYAAELQEERLTVKASINGERKYLGVLRGSSVLDVAAAALGPDDFMHCREFRVYGEPVPSFNYVVVDENTPVEIVLAPYITLTPFWFDCLVTTRDPNLLGLMTDTARAIIDGEFIKGHKRRSAAWKRERRRQQKMRLLAWESGNQIINDGFQKKAHTELRLSILRGCDQSLLDQYQEDETKLYVAIGIREIPPETVGKIIDGLISVRASLPRITVYVPKHPDIPGGFNQPGWMGTATRVLETFGLNVIENHSGEYEHRMVEPREEVFTVVKEEIVPPIPEFDAVMTFLVEAIQQPETESQLRELLTQATDQIAKECLRKFGPLGMEEPPVIQFTMPKNKPFR